MYFFLPRNRFSKELFHLSKLQPLKDTSVKAKQINLLHSLSFLISFLSFTSTTQSSFLFPFLSPSSCSYADIHSSLSFRNFRFIDSSGLTLSYLATNEQSGCAHSPWIKNPHGKLFALYHNTVLISLETNSFSWETAHFASTIPRPTMFVWMRLG